MIGADFSRRSFRRSFWSVAQVRRGAYGRSRVKVTRTGGDKAVITVNQRLLS